MHAPSIREVSMRTLLVLSLVTLPCLALADGEAMIFRGFATPDGAHDAVVTFLENRGEVDVTCRMEVQAIARNADGDESMVVSEPLERLLKAGRRVEQRFDLSSTMQWMRRSTGEASWRIRAVPPNATILTCRRETAAPPSEQPPLLIGTRTDASLGLWDPVTGELVRTYQGAPSQPELVAVSPDGRLVAAIGSDHCEAWIATWNPQSSALLRTTTIAPTGTCDSVDHSRFTLRDLQFSPDGRWLAMVAMETGTGSTPSRALVFDAGTLALSFEPALPGDFATSLAWAPSSDQLYVNLYWDYALVSLRTREVSPRSFRTLQMLAMIVHPSSSDLLAGGPFKLDRYPSDGSEPMILLDGTDTWVHALALSPDGRRVAVGRSDRSNEGRVHIIDPETGGLEVELVAPTRSGIIEHVAFSQDGRYVLSCSQADAPWRRADIWDLQSGSPLASPIQYGFGGCAFLPRL
jgi:WD40 repeat protein